MIYCNAFERNHLFFHRFFFSFKNARFWLGHYIFDSYPEIIWFNFWMERNFVKTCQKSCVLALRTYVFALNEYNGGLVRFRHSVKRFFPSPSRKFWPFVQNMELSGPRVYGVISPIENWRLGNAPFEARFSGKRPHNRSVMIVQLNIPGQNDFWLFRSNHNTCSKLKSNSFFKRTLLEGQIFSSLKIWWRICSSFLNMWNWWKFFFRWESNFLLFLCFRYVVPYIKDLSTFSANFMGIQTNISRENA